MSVPDWQRTEFLDYKTRFYARKSASREAAAAAGGGVVSPGRGTNPLVYLIPFFLLSVAGLGYLLMMKQEGFGQGSLVVTKLRGRVRASDGMRDWSLSKGDRLRPGQRALTGPDGAAELRGADPDTRLLVFEDSSFRLGSLREVREKQYLLEGVVDGGEVMFDFRSDMALWGVDVRLPSHARCLSKRVIMFKVRVTEDACRLVVGDGVVAVVGPAGDKGFVRADQSMRSSLDSPLGKPEGVNVLSERWNL